MSNPLGGGEVQLGDMGANRPGTGNTNPFSDSANPAPLGGLGIVEENKQEEEKNDGQEEEKKDGQEEE